MSNQFFAGMAVSSFVRWGEARGYGLRLRQRDCQVTGVQRLGYDVRMTLCERWSRFDHSDGAHGRLSTLLFSFIQSIIILLVLFFLNYDLPILPFLYFLNVIPFFDTWAGTCDLTVWINVFAFFSYIFKYRPLPHLWSLFFCQKLSRIWCTFTKSHGDLSLWERERSAQSTIAHIACVLSATISSSDPIILASLVEKLMLLSWHTLSKCKFIHICHPD